MPTIHLTNFIAAPVDRVYNLSRNSSIYKSSFQKSQIWPIAGITSGLMNKEESATWKTKFLFKTRFFTNKITELIPNEKVTEKIIKSDFIFFNHEHFFKSASNGTILIDVVEYELTPNFFRNFLNKMYVAPFLEKIINHRIEAIKQYATSDKWRAIL